MTGDSYDHQSISTFCWLFYIEWVKQSKHENKKTLWWGFIALVFKFTDLFVNMLVAFTCWLKSLASGVAMFVVIWSVEWN